MTTKWKSRKTVGALAAAAALGLSGCASTPAPGKDAAAKVTPAQWQASAARVEGAPLAADWWRQFDDPLLAELIAEAEKANPGLQQALARMAQARALASASAAAPQLTASGSLQRTLPLGERAQTQGGASLDARWEIDLFSRARLSDAADQARAELSEFDAAGARMSLAAEVANVYLGLRSCEQQARIAADDARSSELQARFSAERLRVGFEAPGNHALLVAAAADGQSRSLAQQAECQVLVKQLVALGLGEEAALRQRLQARQGQLPEPRRFALGAVPAQTLAQRPDIASAAAQVRAAWADAGSAQAARYPQLALTGNITIAGVRMGGDTKDAKSWSFGPVLSLPLFDGNARRAQAEAAQARFDAAEAGYRGAVLGAVREVEEGLVRLDAALAREGFARSSAQQYLAAFTATEQRWRGGLASAAELEQARRLALAAQSADVQLQRERVGAWIALYKAAGGGWNAADQAR